MVARREEERYRFFKFYEVEFDAKVRFPEEIEKARGGGVYLMYSEYGDLLYIGKTSSFKGRFRQHASGDVTSSGFINYVFYVSYIEVSDPVESDILETYLINTRRPLFNTSKVMTFKNAGRRKRLSNFDAVTEITRFRERNGLPIVQIRVNCTERVKMKVGYRPKLPDGDWRVLDDVFSSREKYRSPNSGKVTESIYRCKPKDIDKTIHDIKWFMCKYGLSKLPAGIVRRFCTKNSLPLHTNYWKRPEYISILTKYNLVRTRGFLEIADQSAEETEASAA